MIECLEERGYSCVRGAGSKGADIVAGKGGQTIAVEVKATKAGPWSGFGPAKRKDFRAFCHQAGWSPVLVWWPTDRKKPLIVPESGWPKDK